MELRLQKRYRQLVESHLNVVQAVAAGVKAIPGVGKAFAATQAAWRFFRNPNVTLPELVQPLRDVGRQACQQSSSAYVLVAFDWSKMDYDGHANKRDLTRLSQELDRGYEMATALLIDANNGAPLAPMGLTVLCEQGMFSTESTTPLPRVAHLDQIHAWMDSAETWKLGKCPVFVIDREADSLKHLRAWDAAGHHYLVRADDRRLSFRGQSRLLSEVVATLLTEDQFTDCGPVSIRGRKGTQWVAETGVILDQPAWGTTKDGKTCRIPGRPLPVRLVIVHVRDENQKLLAEWLLLTNVTAVPAFEVATWYYWRWRIESFHKLLKSSGLELEEWQQESASAITKRLLVGCMACVTVWGLQRENSIEAEVCKTFLVRVSGRQMKRKRPVTTPALMCGLHLLLTMLEILDTHSIDQLRAFAKIATRPLKL
mgnify:CR=1 FL=1